MDKKKQTKVIEKVSAWYSTEGFYQKMIDYEYKDISKYFKGKSVCEIGPADGHHTLSLIKDFSEICCIEPSTQYSKILKKKFGKKISVVTDFIENVNLNRKFDTVICAHLLEHLVDPNSAILQIKELLHKNSVLIIIVPNANSIHRIAGVEMGLLKHVQELNELDKKLGHYRVYDTNELVSQLYNAKLSLVHIGGIYFKVLSQKQLEEWPESRVEAFYKLGRYFPNNCADLLAVCTL